MVDCMTRHAVVNVYIDACAFGAPWKKPTTIMSNFAPLASVSRTCACVRSHLVLQGNSPDGRSWTAVASPYWPALSASWASAFVSVKPCGDLLPAPSHLSGFVVAPSSVRVDQILGSMCFQQPRQRENISAAIRVSSGVQVSGRALPTLLPEGLGPKAHLEVALLATHPMARPVTAPGLCQLAIDAQLDDADLMNSRRATIIRAVRELAAACLPHNVLLMCALHPSVRTTAERRNIVFMKELDFVCGHRDPLLWADYCFGLPMLGFARHSSTMVQRLSKPPMFPMSDEELIAANNLCLSRVGPSGNPKLDMMAWDKTCIEFSVGSLLGPFYSLNELPKGRYRLLPRFAILERHGNATEDSCRVIDDCKLPGLNLESGTTSAHRPLDLDAWCAMIRLVALRFGLFALMAFASDFKSAYRQVPSCPQQQLDFIVVTWDPLRMCHIFAIATCQLFGSGNAPLNFCRFPDTCCTWMAVLFAVCCGHCVDDLLAIERASTSFSAYMSWRALALACGWDVPDSKSPPPSSVLRTLGAMTDLSEFPDGPILLRAVEERCESIRVVLNNVLSSKYLMPALSGKIFGKLGFLSSQFYGRMGRSFLRAFARRQHDANHVGLNPQLRASCEFWLDEISRLRPREVPIDLSQVDVCVSYSDGEGAMGGVGIAVWIPNCQTLAGYIQTPPELRAAWARPGRSEGDERDIYEVEAVGPLLVLHNFGHLMQNKLWIHFCDNEAALATLVKGSSSVLSGEYVAAATHRLIGKWSIWPWFDRVDTGSNPVDKLSRGDMAGDWRLVPIAFPPDFVKSLGKFVGSSA